MVLYGIIFLPRRLIIGSPLRVALKVEDFKTEKSTASQICIDLGLGAPSTIGSLRIVEARSHVERDELRRHHGVKLTLG